jgi:simple sugar transport system permease protein
MRLRFEPRPAPPRALVILAPVAAAALTALAGTVLFALIGHDPAAAFYSYFVKPFLTAYGLAELAVKATPLCLCAIGLAIGFRGNVWNIGAEGQLTIGAVCGGGLALAFHGAEGPLLLPAMIVAGVAGGMAWAAIPAFLKTRFDANEILTSLMLSYVAVLLLGWLVHGPWRDPAGYRFPESRQFDPAATLPILVAGTRLHLGTLFAPLAVAAAWLVMRHSFLGFQIRVVGTAELAARYAGFSRDRVVWVSFLAAGATAGLAGLGEVAGPIGQLLPTISPGYGFAAIIVAFLGRLNPLGVLAASFLMALLYIGAETAQMDLGVPPAVSGVFQGLLLFLILASDTLVRYRIRIGGARRSPA